MVVPRKPPTADRIALASYECFRKLPKAGRPTVDEWTVLSTILESSDDQLKVVALGTGTKCLSADSIVSNGDLLNDSHAEVMARRGFIRYLFHEMHKCLSQQHSVRSPSSLAEENVHSKFIYDTNSAKFRLNDRIGYHFFSSHPPCGDASIFGSAVDDAVDDVAAGPSQCKKRRTDEPKLGFTGGKLVLGEERKSSTFTSLHDDRVDLMAQQPGAIRTKPGRGVRTLSLSCSDKLSRWNRVGIQGALAHSLLCTGGICMESITIAGPSNIEALERAIWKRWPVIEHQSDAAISMRTPVVQQSSMLFEHAEREGLQPSPASIVWCDVLDRCSEVSVSGRRQGVTKKKSKTPMGRLKICKIELLRQYLDLILNDCPEIGVRIGINRQSTYDEVKRASSAYTQASNLLKQSCFKVWTTKPENMNAFICD